MKRRTIAVVSALVVLCCATASKAAPMTVDEALASFRRRNDRGTRKWGNELEAAIQAARGGDPTAIRKWRREWCRIYEYGDPQKGPECVAFNLVDVPAGAPAGADAATLSSEIGTNAPFRAQGVLQVISASGCQSYQCESQWSNYCLAGFEKVDALVHECAGLRCAGDVLLSMQVEADCATEPPEILKMEDDPRQAKPFEGIRGMTRVVSSIAMARAPIAKQQIATCQKESPVPMRCLGVGGPELSYDEYVKRVKGYLDGTPQARLVARRFPGMVELAQQELLALEQSRALIQQRCVVPAAGADVSPENFAGSNGCTDRNLPTDQAAQAMAAYRAAWTERQERVAELQQQQVAAAQQQQALASQEAAARLASYNKLAMEKRGSKACRVAESWVNYCTTAGSLLNVEAAISRMKRIDGASGTVNLLERRRLAETKLVLEDQLKVQSRSMLGLQVAAAPAACRPADAMRATAQNACVLSSTAADAIAAAPPPSPAGGSPEPVDHRSKSAKFSNAAWKYWAELIVADRLDEALKYLTDHGATCSSAKSGNKLQTTCTSCRALGSTCVGASVSLSIDINSVSDDDAVLKFRAPIATVLKALGMDNRPASSQQPNIKPATAHVLCQEETNTCLDVGESASEPGIVLVGFGRME